MASSEAPDDRRGPGRPRKWATEADRARAYRQRRAEEQAGADELRVERRVLKRQLSDAVRGRQRAEVSAQRATARAEALADDLALAREQLARTRSEISRLEETIEAERLAHRGERQPVEVQAGLSRQQRRAMERNERKRRR